VARRCDRVDPSARTLAGAQQFCEPALRATYTHYRVVLASRDAHLDAIEADLAGWYDRPPFAEQVARLSAYRGVTRLGALSLAAEVCDWRRFAQASQFMGFCGLVPSEYSSGQRTARGHLTKAGNAHLRAQPGRVGLVLPTPARGRHPDRRPPPRPGPAGDRAGVGNPAAPLRPVPPLGRP
jgi:transposase